MWINKLKDFNLLKNIYKTSIPYGSPVNLTYAWNFGFLALIFLVIQVLTGFFLSMHYVANANLAFYSVEHIMRDVNNGWLIRYCHANGASLFFIVTYLHIFRNLYYSTYLKPKQFLWISGMLILIIMIITAFTGYVLPWGQMSFWAATVITNSFSAIPNIGNNVVIWLWGGYAIDSATLNRFYSLHMFLPFILIFLVFIHLILLHELKSLNWLGINSFKLDNNPFISYYFLKDFIGLFFFLLFYYFNFLFPKFFKSSR